jgi:predicted amidophosphoribosyltransferase
MFTRTLHPLDGLAHLFTEISVKSREAAVEQALPKVGVCEACGEAAELQEEFCTTCVLRGWY